MTEYHIEELLDSTKQDQMNALSEAGWELVCAHAHPFKTDGAQAVFVTYWKRAA